MDFHEFHRFSEDVMRFYGFQGSEVWKRSDVCRRGPAPIETFTRSQLPAISWISMDFHGFRSQLADISSIYIDFKIFMRFHEFPQISMDFVDFHRFRSPGSQPFAAEVLPLQKPLLDPSCRPLADMLSVVIDFMGFHEIPWISMDFDPSWLIFHRFTQISRFS